MVRKQNLDQYKPVCEMCQSLRTNGLFKMLLGKCSPPAGSEVPECIRIVNSLKITRDDALKSQTSFQAILDKKDFVCNASHQDMNILVLLLASMINTTLVMRVFYDHMAAQKVPQESQQTLVTGLNLIADRFCDRQANTRKQLIIRQ